MLLSETLRRPAHDRVFLLRHLGPPHLRQGQGQGHPRHLELFSLQTSSQYKPHGLSRQENGRRQGAEEKVSRILVSGPLQLQTKIIKPLSIVHSLTNESSVFCSHDQLSTNQGTAFSLSSLHSLIVTLVALLSISTISKLGDPQGL